MGFEHDVYIVLDLADPLAGAVMQLRRKFDPKLTGIPVEIGVAGSSGLGALVNNQDPERVFKSIENCSKSIECFDLRFKSLKRFPETKWYYFEPSTPDPFYQIHEWLRDSEIEFRKSPYPYTPHCSVADLKDRPVADEAALKEAGIPAHACLMDRISVYSLTPDGHCDLLFQATLRVRS